jgi:integrase
MIPENNPMKANIRDSVIPQLWRDASTWKFRYRHAGRARTLTLGAYPLLTPQAARRACQVAGALVAVGRCPATERRAMAAESRLAKKPARDYVEKVAAQYLKHAKARTRASTWTETKRVFDPEILPAWRGRRLSEITKADVRKLVDSVAKRAPVGANRLLASLKTFLAFTVEQDILTVSPAASVRPPAPEKARERVLTDDELAAVLKACTRLGAYGQGVILLALTGQRRSEIFGALWSEFDLTTKLWTLPAARAKNGRQHSIPLSDAAIAILESLKSANPAVFEPQSFSRCKAELGKLLPGMAPFTVHDLRRTFASGCARLGVRIEVVERALNHASGSFRGIVGVYQKYDFADEKRAALDAWSEHVAALPSRTASLSEAV